MIRIGFDPGLEVEQQHREVIKQSEYYRLIQDRTGSSRESPLPYQKILAQLGKRLALFGSALEGRYGGQSDSFRSE
jgi:hypothetical protein